LFLGVCVLLDHATCALVEHFPQVASDQLPQVSSDQLPQISDVLDEIDDISHTNIKQLVDSIQNIGNVMEQQLNIIDLAKNASEGIKEGLGNTDNSTRVTTLRPDAITSVPQCDVLLTLHPLDPSSYPGCTQDDVQSCLKAELNMTLLMNGNRISVPGGVCMDLTDRCQNYAVFQSHQGEEAVFNWDNKTVSGNINTNKGSFSLEGCKACGGKADKCFLLIQYNTSNLEETEPILDDVANGTKNCGETKQAEIYEQNWEVMRPELQAQGEKDSTTIVNYSVMIWTTYQFDDTFASIDDRNRFIDAAFTSCNVGYKNSKIPIRVKLHGVKSHPLNDTNISVEKFAQYMPHRQTRNCADAAILLVKAIKDTCGEAFLGAYNCMTLGIVRKACTTDNYSFGHELSHMFGAQHNREQYDNPEGDWYGYHIRPGVNGTTARTIMAYPKHGANIPRRNYYSNPDVIYPGTNTATGVFGEANNARQISSNRFLISACNTKDSDDLCTPAE